MSGPFVIFVIVLVVIWTLSGLASWVNKQKEAERRRMLRAQMGQQPGMPPMRQAPRGPRRPPVRTISPGLAERFPDVLVPPAPMPPPRQPQRQMPQRQVTTRVPIQARPTAKRPKSRPVPQPPPVLMMEEDVPHARVVEEAAPQLVTRGAPPSPRINADTLSRWLRPQTLNQQFVLTEIFQPPLAMRE